MAGESKLHRIAPEALPELLRGLDEKTTGLALIGLDGYLSASSDNWPEELQECDVYQLSGGLSELPYELLQLEWLKVLVIRDFRLEDADVVEIAEHLGQLTSLNLSNNKVGDAGARAIAENLGQLTSLALGFNQVGKAGARAIAENLGQLISLNLSYNKVGNSGARAIAEHLGQLTSLNLSNNKVGNSGARMLAEHLKHLTALDLNDNDVGTGGALAISEHLRQLTSLDLGNSSFLGNNKVSNAGARVLATHLGQLTSLNLEDNGVGEVGARVIATHLGQLTSLNLNSNEVGDSGARVLATHLRQLTSLDLNSNEVGDSGARAIAKHLGQLTSLNLGSDSFLSSNKVGDSGARAIAKHLRQLTSLNLSSNQLGNKAVTAIGQKLKNLIMINLQENEKITTIAPLAQLSPSTLNIAKTGVADLSPMKSLVLSGLSVTWSSSTWKGPGIYVEDCPLMHPSPEIVQQGPEAVLNFFQEIEAQGVERLFEAKLLIVGEGGAGKTSLLRRMFLSDMDLPSEDATTRGIDIHRHEFPMPNGRTFRLNTWDFGGQQIYHATHQFFLTKRSLYVLVDDTRSDNRSIHDEGFRFWLEVVETLSEASPLLIFQNEKGGRSKKIDEAGIKGRFPNVKDIHKGNLEHPDAANSLCEAVEHFAKQLPHIGEDVPAKWVAIRNDLKDLAQTNAYISLRDYYALYERHLELDEGKALKLSQYLHDLG